MANSCRGIRSVGCRVVATLLLGAGPVRAAPVVGARLTAVATPAAPTKAARPVRYLVWEIGSLGVEESVAQLIERMFLAELGKVLGDGLLVDPPGLTLQARAAVEQCGASTACLTEAGGALGADRVIVGTIGALGARYSLNVKLIDARAGVDLKRAQRTLEGDRAKVLDGLQKLIFELIDPAFLQGSLRVDIALDGASIIIDGVEAAKTPLSEPIEGLAAGEHTLKVTSPIMQDYFTFFTVQYGKTTEVKVDGQQIAALKAQIAVAREAIEVPVYKKWWFWTAAAVVVAGGAAAAVAVSTAAGQQGGPPATSIGEVDFSAP